MCERLLLWAPPCTRRSCHAMLMHFELFGAWALLGGGSCGRSGLCIQHSYGDRCDPSFILMRCQPRFHRRGAMVTERVQECAWSPPDDACAGHAQDSIVYCTASAKAEASQGAVRLIAADGSPAIDGKGRPEIYMEGTWAPVCSSGASAGAAGVLCKAMGFSGASGHAKCSGAACGDAAPGISELACSGSEADPLACPHEAGDDVFCAPSESLVITCAGDGETQGRPAKESAPQSA